MDLSLSRIRMPGNGTVALSIFSILYISVFDFGLQEIITPLAPCDPKSTRSRRLKSTGNMPGIGFGTVTTGQDSSAPWQ